MWSPIFNLRLGIYRCNIILGSRMLNSPVLPSPSSEYNSSLRFYQFLSERLCVGWFFLCTDTRINFHWSIAFQSSSPSPSGLHPSRPSFFPFVSLSLARTFFSPSSSLRFRIRLSSFPLPPFSPPSFFLAVDFCERNGGGVKRTLIAAVRTYVCVSRLGHGSLPARAIPRFAAGPWETAHLPSFRWNGQTTAEQRDFASLPPPFTRQQPCGLLHLTASFSSNDTVLP